MSVDLHTTTVDGQLDGITPDELNRLMAEDGKLPIELQVANTRGALGHLEDKVGIKVVDGEQTFDPAREEEPREMIARLEAFDELRLDGEIENESFDPQLAMAKGVQVASNDEQYTAAEIKRINERWEKLSLEDVHEENIHIIKNILDPIHTSFRQVPGERRVKREQLTQALRDYAKKVNLKKDITGMNAENIAIAMLTEYYEIFDKKTAKQGKEEIRAFLFRDIIPIIRPYLK